MRGGLHLIYLFDLRTHAVIGSFDALGGDIRCLKFSPDGELLVAVYASDPALRVFNRQGGLVYEERLQGNSFYADFSSSGQLAVTVFAGAIQLYATAGGKIAPTGEIKTDPSRPMSVSFSPDGRRLAVGYADRSPTGRVRIDVFDVANRKLEKAFEFRDIYFGSLQSVAWQSNGEALYAAGTGYHGKNRFIAKRISWPDGLWHDLDVAGNSVFDLFALRNGSILFATAEPRWGIIVNNRVEEPASASAPRFFNVSTLRSNSDATVVSWENLASGTSAHFSLQDRSITDGRGDATRMAETSNLSMAVAWWENSSIPTLNGARLPIDRSEISRAVAIVPDGSALLLATSDGLRKFDSTGHLLWVRLTSTEARSVILSSDGRVAATAMSDGTIRWWRVSDGALLMSLFAARDGRWVTWTELGYFDVSAGGEDLIGLLVNRPEGDRADFYPISRFREKYFRPDVIDHVLSDADPEIALKHADEARRSMTAKQAPASALRTADADASVAEPSESTLPPVVELRTSADATSAGSGLNIEYTLSSTTLVTAVTVRVNGRFFAELIEGLPAADGKTKGNVVVPMPNDDAVVQLFATNTYGTSAPATLNYKIGAKRDSMLEQSNRDGVRLFVLSVGISRYANSAYNASATGDHARDIAGALLGEKGNPYSDVAAKVLSDNEATRAAIVKAMTTYAATSRPEDVVIVYLAGVAVDDAAGRYRFFSYDGDMSKLATTSIGEDEIGRAVSAIRGKVIVLLDTCRPANAVGSSARQDLTRISNKLASPEIGAVVLAACTRKATSPRQSGDDGVFARTVIQGLLGEADFRHQGRVTYSDLGYFVTTKVKQVTAGSEIPVLTAPSGLRDFVLVDRPSK